jgi:tripartite-type tricarboxylate transporter receptor subunit TctC
LPTVAAAGLPGYEASLISAVIALAKTPPAIINRLNEEIVRVLGDADIKQRLFAAGLETVGSTPDELTETAKAEVSKWGKLIKEAGIRTWEKN